MHRLAIFLLLATLTAHAQTLARPGLAGSGLNTDPWWKQAVFYQVSASPANPPGGNPAEQLRLMQSVDYKSIATRLDALHTLGIDALLLPMPGLPGSPEPTPALDDFDGLIHQASQRGIRVLLTFPAPSPSADLAPTARFWLNHGVAGFRLVTHPSASPQDTQFLVQSLRTITNSAVGQRIVLSDFNSGAIPTPIPSPPSRRAPTARSNRSVDSADAQLQVDSQLSQLNLLDARSLRPLLAQSLTTSNLLLDFHPPAAPPNSPDPYPALSRAIATILLTTHPAALVNADPGLELQPSFPSANPLPTAPPAPTLADWYSKLSALHHGNATVRYGSVTTLNFDTQDALVWVIRPASNSGLAPPVVVACNLSSSPLQLSLSSAIHGLNLRGSFLLTLLRTDEAMGAQNLGSVSLPPFAVYIGELHR
jgi:alpha-glucosidase